MLRIYPVVLDFIRRQRSTISLIERKDRDLGRQLRRASASAGLNLAEGMYSRGENRGAKYHIALGSAREMLACLELAEAFGYVRSIDPSVRAECDGIVGTLVRLVENCQ
jgi:four helix bundle protein